MYTSGRPWGGVQASVTLGVRAAVRASASANSGVVRTGVRRAVHVAAHRLDPGRHEDVTLAGLDGVGGHADALEGGRAVAVHRHAGRVLESRQNGGDARHVVARLTRRLGTAEDDVLHVGGVELGHLGEHRLDDEGAQIVGAALDQGALVGPPDRGAAGGDDDGFGHGDSLLASILCPGMSAPGRIAGYSSVQKTSSAAHWPLERAGL